MSEPTQPETPGAAATVRPTVETPTEVAAVAQPSAPEPAERPSSSLWGDAWRALRGNPLFMVPALFVLVVASMAAFPKLWTRTDPRVCELPLSRKGPSAEHIFGNSQLGCDIYAQTVYGARPSIQVAIISTTGIVLLGGLLGILAGFYGGWVDTIIARVADIFIALPLLLGALVFLSVLKSRSVWTISVVLIILIWPVITRIMRSSVLSSKNLDYVQAARVLGATNSRLMFKHILPNAVAPTVVYATIALGSFVTTEATLSFLGVGLVPPAISWGIMINEGQTYVLEGSPHMLLFPGGFLVCTVLSFILMGDALRDALDPKLR